MSVRCPNCGADTDGRYCPSCGQDNRRPRLDTRSVLSDAFQNLVGWESALVRTLRGLARDPGGMAREYVDGRRRAFVNPARFCLLSLALWMLVSSLVGSDPVRMTGLKITSAVDSDGVDFSEQARAVVARYLDLFLYVSLPAYALLLNLLFRKARRNLAEVLVLVLYVEGLGFLLGALFAPFSLAAASAPVVVRALLMAVWRIYAARVFFGVGWLSAAWRVLLCRFLFVPASLLLFLAAAILWMSLTG